MEKITWGGIVTLLIILSSGTTFYIQSLGEKTSCKNGWIYENNGDYEGYYKCITSTNVRYEMCFNVYDSANTKNYWCEKGKLIKKEELQIKENTNIKRWLCKIEGCEVIS